VQSHAQTQDYEECGMQRIRIPFLIIVITITLFPLFATGQKEAVVSEQSPYSITDSRGVVITLKEAPQRIVSLSPNLTEILFALGIGDKVVGRTEYCDYPVEASDIPTVGDLFSPSIEKILSLEPDLVVIGNLGQAQTIDALERSGLTVAFIDEGETLEGTSRLITKVGTLTGVPEKALEVNQAIDDSVKKAQSFSFDPPTVYYVAGFGEWGDFTATGDTYLHDIITTAGAINIASDAVNWGYQVELILAHDPDIIILPALWGSTSEETKRIFTTTPPYNTLTAVKEDRIITSVENSIIERQGPRSGQAVLLLAQAIANILR